MRRTITGGGRPRGATAGETAEEESPGHDNRDSRHGNRDIWTGEGWVGAPSRTASWNEPNPPPPLFLSKTVVILEFRDRASLCLRVSRVAF